MNILSIDTTADICSVALLVGDHQFTFHEDRPRQHAKILLPEIERLFLKANIRATDLDMVVFGRGPGSFTGIRIATGVAQGLAYSANCSVLPISTLQSLAFTASRENAKNIWVAIDARMAEVYFARYVVDDRGIPMPVGEECVILPEALPVDIANEPSFIGNGWLAGYPLPPVLADQDFSTFQAHSLPSALDSAMLAQLLLKHGDIEPVTPEEAQPTYLRDNVTWTQKPKVGS